MAMDVLSEERRLMRPQTPAEMEEFDRAQREVAEFLVGLGWKSRTAELSNRAAERDLVEAFVGLRRVVSQDIEVDVMLPYALAVEELAQIEIPGSGRQGTVCRADTLRRARPRPAFKARHPLGRAVEERS
jgi:hypothetical protein